MTTGAKIQLQRKNQGLTQEQLAEILDVTRQSVSKWESDGAYPETDKLIRMSSLFHVSVDYLLRDEVDDPDPSPALRTEGKSAAKPAGAASVPGEGRVRGAVRQMKLSCILMVSAGVSVLVGFACLELSTGIFGDIPAVLFFLGAPILTVIAFFRRASGLAGFRGLEPPEPNDFSLRRIEIRWRGVFWDVFALSVLIGSLPTAYFRFVNPAIYLLVFVVKIVHLRKLRFRPKKGWLSVTALILFFLFFSINLAIQGISNNIGFGFTFATLFLGDVLLAISGFFSGLYTGRIVGPTTD